jgi:hypothetical protein
MGYNKRRYNETIENTINTMINVVRLDMLTKVNELPANVLDQTQGKLGLQPFDALVSTIGESCKETVMRNILSKAAR